MDRIKQDPGQEIESNKDGVEGGGKKKKKKKKRLIAVVRLSE